MASNRGRWAVRVVRGALVGFALAGLYGALVDSRADESMLRAFERQQPRLEELARQARAVPYETCDAVRDETLRAQCRQLAVDHVQASASEVRLSIAHAGSLHGQSGYAWRAEPPTRVASRVGPRVEPPSASGADACAPVYRHIAGAWYLFVTRC